jgi:ribose-phosphate pyrophosphokinase
MILNLAYPENSEIQFKISRFPDGQQTLDIVTSHLNSESLFKWAHLNREVVQIKSHLNSFKDLELIICANQALINCGVEHVELYVPYFLGARSDRQFQVGGVNYLKQVICPIINSQNFASVTVLDPHSDVLEACLNNYRKHDNHDLVKWALTLIDNKDGAQDRICLVSPDAGAYKKIFDVAKKFKITNVVTANKVRDLVSGDIISTQVPLSPHDADKTFVIIDDICDGGRTFIELAKAIKKTRSLSSSVHPDNYGKIYLIVTHGIFSARYSQLSEHIDGIFCTNSIKDIGETEYRIVHIKTNVKQMNVF